MALVHNAVVYEVEEQIRTHGNDTRNCVDTLFRDEAKSVVISMFKVCYQLEMGLPLRHMFKALSVDQQTFSEQVHLILDTIQTTVQGKEFEKMRELYRVLYSTIEQRFLDEFQIGGVGRSAVQNLFFLRSISPRLAELGLVKVACFIQRLVNKPDHLQNQFMSPEETRRISEKIEKILKTLTG